MDRSAVGTESTGGAVPAPATEAGPTRVRSTEFESGNPADGFGLGVLVLAGLASTICFLGVGSGPPLGDHECIHAQCARQALDSGQWLIPYFNDVPRVNKPPLGMWLIAVSAMLFDPPGRDLPVSELAARLPQALAGFLHVLAACWAGTQMFGRRAGLVAGFIAAASAMTLYFSHSALIEMTLVLFTTLSYGCFWRATHGERISGRWMALFYLSFGGAMMCKFPLPLALVGLPLAIYWIVGRPIADWSAQDPVGAGLGSRGLLSRVWNQVRAIPRLWIVPGTILFAVVAGAWPLYAWSEIDGVLGLWRTEFLERFSGQMSDKVRAWWYYVPIIFGLATPYLLSLPEALVAPFLPRYRQHRRALMFCLTWGVVGMAFLSTASFKRPHYSAAVMPAFMLLLAPVIDRLFLGGHWRSEGAVKAGCYVLLAALVGGLLTGLFFVNMYVPEILRPCLVAAALLGLLWGGACVAFQRGFRASSLALLNLGSLALMVFGWQAAEKLIRTDEQALVMAEGFGKIGLGPDDRIVWVDSRVDATTAYYGGLRIGRLFTPAQMSNLRRGRRRISPAVYVEAAARMERALEEDHDTYFILQAGRFEAFRNHFDLPAEEKFRVSGFKADPDDDLVIIGPIREGASERDSETTSRPFAEMATPIPDQS